MLTRGFGIGCATVLSLSACTGAGAPRGPAEGSPSFDGGRAFALVKVQVSFGPRVPGREGHARQAAWMHARLDSLAPEVLVDTFRHATAVGDTLTLFNFLARFRPDLSRRIVLLAHWDTRPTSDQASDPERAALPVPGANDGASGTAVLLELAALMAEAPPPLGVDLLLLDGEDYGPEQDDMFLGARRYADQLRAAASTGASEGLVIGSRPVYGLLLDMVGDEEPSFPVEAHSAEHAGAVVRKVWRAAERLGHGAYFPQAVGRRLYDDHVPLIEAGLPTANLIDFVYGPGNRYWHTPDDTPEHVSAATLGIVGEVVTELIYSGG